MNMKNNPRVLVSPLEWGLGHATRLARLIRILLDQNMEVVIAADGLPYNFLMLQFPQLTFVRVPFTQVSYSTSRMGFFTKLLFQIPAIMLAISKTRKQVRQLAENYNIDYIISDNRYGFSHPNIPSVFISHQLRPQPPKTLAWVENLFCRFHLRMIRHFDYWWIPDYEGKENVTARLSHLPWINEKIKYIEPLSWLDQDWPEEKLKYGRVDIVFLLSGPEPQRSILETKAITLLRDSTFRSLILQGLPHPAGEESQSKKEGNCIIVNHLPGSQILQYLKNTQLRICRAGVVSVFDLAALRLPALLIPSDGQTEQEYVARHLFSQGYFDYCEEKDLSLDLIDKFSRKSFKTFPKPEGKALAEAMDRFFA